MRMAETPSTDRNLYVNAISYDGRTLVKAAALDADGAKTFNVTDNTVDLPPPVIIGSGSDTLVLSMSEDAWQGNSEFTVSVDGMQLGGTFTTTASHASGASQNFTFKDDWAPGTHNVSVTFLNDAYGGTTSTDRNLYVNAINYDGTNTGQSAALYTDGTKTFSVADSTAIPQTAYYVAVNGSDTTGDGSAAHPFATSPGHDPRWRTARFTRPMWRGAPTTLPARSR